MNGKINVYGRARRLALYRNIAIIVGCLFLIVFLVSQLFKKDVNNIVLGEYEQLRSYFLKREFTCESLEESGGKCISTTDNVKTTFYRYKDGFEYIVKSDSYTLSIIHRLENEDSITFKTTSEAFDGYKNQKFVCAFKENVLDKVSSCEAEKDGVILDINSYLGIIEQAQTDLINAINSSDYSLDSLLLTYEWIKK